MTVDEAKRAAEAAGLHIDRVSPPGDGDVYLFAFGGEPNEAGTHPRRVTLMICEDEDDVLVVATRGRETVFALDVDEPEISQTLTRAARFLRDGKDS